MTKENTEQPDMTDSEKIAYAYYLTIFKGKIPEGFKVPKELPFYAKYEAGRFTHDREE